MTLSDQSSTAKARRFHALHQDSPLVLPNAWDAGSARVIAEAGAQAIATTSGGVSWSHGRPDSQGLSRAQMIAAVSEIVAAVDLPVSADIEGGYGPSLDDVAQTVAATVGAGAVGINLEDSAGHQLLSPDEQAARISAARQAAAGAGLPELFINVRTDVYLFQIGRPENRLDDVIARVAAYAEAGADGLFVPGLIDLGTLEQVVARSPLPVNVMAGPGAPSVAEFAGVGVARVSAGTALAQAALTLTHLAASELLQKGTYDTLRQARDFGDLNTLFAG